MPLGLKLNNSKTTGHQKQASPTRNLQQDLTAEKSCPHCHAEIHLLGHPEEAQPPNHTKCLPALGCTELVHHFSSVQLGPPEDSGYVPVSSLTLSSPASSSHLSTVIDSGLAEHRFIHLVQYSVLRAFVANATILSLPTALFLDDSALSPYTVFNPMCVAAVPPTHTLSPTKTQLSTFHHPFIDILASPSLRDNVLIATLSEEQEEIFCTDLHCNGFTVWGRQSWDPMGWEVSQEFCSKWGWLLDESTIRYSNFWRAERGELPLRLETTMLETG